MPETATRPPGPNATAIQSVARACVLLEQLAGLRVAGVVQLSAATGLRPATVHRLLRALCAAGVVTQDPATRLYQPTLRLFEWGQAAVLRLQVREVAKPFLQSLAAEVKETATLGLREGADVIYVEWIPGRHLIQPRVHIGARVPAYRSSLGQCLLAWLSDDERRRLLHGRPLVRGGPNTLLSVAAIEQRLAEVRARGYAIDNEEHAAGVRAVGAPLHDAAGRVVAAIGLGAPASRMPPRRIAQLGQRLIEVAHTISSHLGYSAGATPQSATR
ncbi:MAG: IclR family transcriptional regulator [Chloroflexi bacterium]|nr:IclR family transcriptional regulator [Chloroflexota bacterium]